MKKRVLSYILLCTLVISSFCGCRSAKNETPEEKSSVSSDEDADTKVYHVGVCLSEDTDYYNFINSGFCDALSDIFPDGNVKYEIQTISPENSGESIMQYFLGNNVDLIFANGTAALSAASIATFETPIVAAGVIDYRTTLHIISGSWNRTTKRNITGISGAPSVSNQLSMLLETKPDLKHIGILYSAEDTDSIYQNELLESYLNEAGIPWKEYKLTSSMVSSSQYELEEDSTAIILPGEIAKASSKEGSSIPTTAFGESNLISGILSPNSARASQVSERWDGAVETEATENEEIVKTACEECDAIYIAADSSLSDQIEMISTLANENKTLTLGGDMTLGKHTLITLYADPYDMGYRAGKMVKRILINEEDPGEIKISLPSSNVTKLYQDDVAELFELTFPKSFREYDEFVENYEVGSNTNRVVSEDNEE